MIILKHIFFSDALLHDLCSELLLFNTRHNTYKMYNGSRDHKKSDSYFTFMFNSV